VPNRFELVLAAARRAKQLLKGARPLVEADNKELVVALREIAAGKVCVVRRSDGKGAPSAGATATKSSEPRVPAGAEARG